jgi:hypothetical protein
VIFFAGLIISEKTSGRRFLFTLEDLSHGVEGKIKIVLINIFGGIMIGDCPVFKGAGLFEFINSPIFDVGATFRMGENKKLFAEGVGQGHHPPKKIVAKLNFEDGAEIDNECNFFEGVGFVAHWFEKLVAGSAIIAFVTPAFIVILGDEVNQGFVEMGIGGGSDRFFDLKSVAEDIGKIAIKKTAPI